MSRAGELLQIAIPFVWLGMVLAISGLETPLKFRAPGVTRAVGLGIGRLVFRFLNIAELVLLVALTAALAGAPWGVGRVVLVAVLWVLLLAQMCGLRPPLDRRVKVIVDGGRPPQSSLHHWYIALEAVKILALPVIGVLLTIPLLA
jgi:hypothetical protein